MHKVKYLRLNIKSQGLPLGLLFGSCTSMLLEPMPRALQQAHGVGEHKTQRKHRPQRKLPADRSLQSKLPQPRGAPLCNQHFSFQDSPLIFPPKLTAHVVTCCHSHPFKKKPNHPSSHPHTSIWFLQQPEKSCLLPSTAPQQSQRASATLPLTERDRTLTEQHQVPRSRFSPPVKARKAKGKDRACVRSQNPTHALLIRCAPVQARHEGLFQLPVGYSLTGQAGSTGVEPNSGGLLC